MASTLRVIVGIVFCLSLVLLPTGIAILRNHSRTGSILVWNTLGMLLLGIGWLVALVMALTDGGAGSQTVIIQNVVTQHNGNAKE
jgi:hypothetical protein